MLDFPPHLTMLIFLILITPICFWVVFTDLKYMKIRNAASLALVVVFAVAGPLLLPLDIWLWRWVNLVAMLIFGIILNATTHFGMGDVKFAAAAAPFFAQSGGSFNLVLLLLMSFILAGFAAHRILRAIPAVRHATPDWISWTRADFPFGLALAGTLWSYYALLAVLA